MPLHAIAEAVVGLEIIGGGVAVAEGVALVIVVRQIFGELVVHLKLEVLRHLLLEADRKSAVERFGGAFQCRQLADAVALVGAKTGAPGRAEDSGITVDEAAGMY